MPQAQPELKKVSHLPPPVTSNQLTQTWFQYLDKRLFVQLNGSRKVIGVLRGFDVRIPSPETHSNSCLVVSFRFIPSPSKLSSKDFNQARGKESFLKPIFLCYPCLDP